VEHARGVEADDGPIDAFFLPWRMPSLREVAGICLSGSTPLRIIITVLEEGGGRPLLVKDG
jgi:hypothetical protein